MVVTAALRSRATQTRSAAEGRLQSLAGSRPKAAMRRKQRRVSAMGTSACGTKQTLGSLTATSGPGHERSDKRIPQSGRPWPDAGIVTPMNVILFDKSTYWHTHSLFRGFARSRSPSVFRASSFSVATARKIAKFPPESLR